MTRLLPALLLAAIALVGCDAAAPSAPAVGDATAWDQRAGDAVVMLGVVEAADGRWRTVGGVAVLAGRTTQILGSDGFAATLDDVGVGAGVEVRGRLRADGNVRARSLRLWSPTGGDAKALEGTIDAIGDKTLTVDGTHFETDTLTRWLGPEGEALGPEAFEVGHRVAAAGHTRGGALTADVVKMDR